MLDAAVRNNAAWCDLVCTSVGAPGAFAPDLYVNVDDVPRFYPNAVTLSDAVRTDDVLSALAGRDRWSVKDSFDRLDLADAGLARLFRAHWLVAAPRPAPAGVGWTIVDDAAALDAWTAERGDEATSTLVAAWADRPDLAYVGVVRNGERVGSGVLFRSHDVVGLSNTACAVDDPVRCWTALIETSLALFPGVPVVAYEGADGMRAAASAGCEELGPLAVWATADLVADLDET